MVGPANKWKAELNFAVRACCRVALMSPLILGQCATLASTQLHVKRNCKPQGRRRSCSQKEFPLFCSTAVGGTSVCIPDVLAELDASLMWLHDVVDSWWSFTHHPPSPRHDGVLGTNPDVFLNQGHLHGIPSSLVLRKSLPRCEERCACVASLLDGIFPSPYRPPHAVAPRPLSGGIRASP